MPRDRKTPLEQTQLDAANRRAQWQAVFSSEVIRLRPHMSIAGKMLAGIATVELKSAGIESDPVAVAGAWHERSAPAPAGKSTKP